MPRTTAMADRRSPTISLALLFGVEVERTRGRAPLRCLSFGWRKGESERPHRPRLCSIIFCVVYFEMYVFPPTKLFDTLLHLEYYRIVLPM